MKPAQIASLLVAALVAACGVALKFTSLFPGAVVPYFGIFAGTVGPFLITMLPPVLQTPFSDHVEHELARLFQIGTFGLGVLPGILALNHAPAVAADWCSFAAAMLAALGVIFLPKAQAVSKFVKSVDEVTAPGGPKALATFLPFVAVGLVLSVGACTFAQFKQDLSAAEAKCGAKTLNDVMAAIDGGAAAIISDVIAAVEDAACIYEAIGALAAKNGGALTAAQKENAAKLVSGVKKKLGLHAAVPNNVAALVGQCL